MSLAAGARLGRYEIMAPLGAGGMGEVYRAHDPQLGRDVALKILPASTANDPDALERFTREARALAALNHPHIVTIYSTEEADGVRFLTMELIEGRTLDQVIPERGMSLPQFFDVAIALADALAAAHDKHITHRDLKPANVMVTGAGRVKVLDFGLARASAVAVAGAGLDDDATRLALTQAGTILGTAAYMSPEQIEGKPLDGRSDLFSLGIVLYEMATGTRPFRGGSSPAVMAAVMKDQPPPAGEARPDLAGVSRLIARCLEKDPRDRPQSAPELLIELKALKSGAEFPALPARQGRKTWMVAAAIAVAVLVASGGALFLSRVRGGGETAPSIAVLPFIDMSEAKDQEYFSDGISEELLNLLAKVPALRVTSRSSAFSFKGKSVDLTEIGKRLNVGHILEGSIRKSGKRVRITAQLIDARTDKHVWSETYDRTLDDVFAVQDEIAAAVVTHLKVTLLGDMVKARKVDPQAHELFLQATDAGQQAKIDRYVTTIGMLRQALAIDPTYVAAWSTLAQAYANEGGQGVGKERTSDESFRLAREAARRAIALDPEYPWGYVVLGQIAMNYDNDMAGAAAQIQHALSLDPRSAGLMLPAAALVQNLGRVNEAVALREYNIARDPLSPFAQFNLGITYLYAGRPDEAIAAVRKSLALAPRRAVAHYIIGLALLAKRDAAGALAEFELEPSVVWKQIGLPMAYHALGRKAESDGALAKLIAEQEKHSAFNIASVLSFRGEPDRAFEWLDKAVTYHDAGISTASFDHLLDGLHSDPRWLPFLRRNGKAPEQLAAIKFEVALPKEGS